MSIGALMNPILLFLLCLTDFFYPTRVHADSGVGVRDDRLAWHYGNDQLYCGSGNDTARGGPGYDVLTGEAAPIDLKEWAGRIIFAGDLSEDRLRFVKVGDDLEIRINDSPADRLIVVNWFDTCQVAYIRSADGYAIPPEIITRDAVRE